MNCKNCGYNMPSSSAFCPNCGLKIEDNKDISTEKNVQNEQKVTPVTTVVNNSIDESGAVGWGILGFFFPFVGLILFLVWLRERPKSSKAAGIGALIRVILNVFLFIIFFIIGFAISYSAGTYY